MPYGTTSKKSGSMSTGKSLSQMTKAEKEQRARDMNTEYAKTATTKRSKGKTVQGGMKPSFGQKLFGGKGKSTASTPKGMIKLSNNPRKREKQIAEKRERGNSVCSPTSKSKKCGPNAK